MNTNDKNIEPLNSLVPIDKILQFWSDNSVVYQALVNNNSFIPFVGAGLVAGIGIGSWRELMDAVAEKVFSKAFDDFDNIVVSREGIEKISFCVWTLGRIDLDDKKHEGDWKSNIFRRYDEILKFAREARSGEEGAQMLWVLYDRLINSNHKYSYYEAGQVLEFFGNGKQEIKQTIKECFKKKKNEDGTWDIKYGSAVLWLPRITRPQLTAGGKEVYKCVTTNFDDILECVYGSDSASVIHLHESIDGDKQICFALSDLYRIYEDISEECKQENAVKDISSNYNKHAVSNVINVQRHLTDVSPYLFLGSSLSESHIAMVVSSFLGYESLEGENYAIVGFEDDDKNDISARKYNFVFQKVNFGLNGRILLYPIKHGDHSALEVLLHQLSRDKERRFWNCRDNFELFLPQNNLPLNSHEESCVYSMVQWLEEGGAFRKVKVEPSVEVNFTTEGTQGLLTYIIGDGIPDAVHKAIGDIFMVPKWMTCFMVIGVLNRFQIKCGEELYPLGNTLYVIIEYQKENIENEDETDKQVEEMVNETPYNTLKCRILHIVLPYKYVNKFISRIAKRPVPKMDFDMWVRMELSMATNMELGEFFEKLMNSYTENRDNQRIPETRKTIDSVDKLHMIFERLLEYEELDTKIKKEQIERDRKLVRR